MNFEESKKKSRLEQEDNNKEIAKFIKTLLICIGISLIGIIALSCFL